VVEPILEEVLAVGGRGCAREVVRLDPQIGRIVGIAAELEGDQVVVLGGAGTLIGGVIGSAIVLLLREYLSTLVPWWQYVLGGVYVLTILYLPTGLMGIPKRIRQALSQSDNKPIAHLASTRR